MYREVAGVRNPRKRRMERHGELVLVRRCRVAVPSMRPRSHSTKTQKDDDDPLVEPLRAFERDSRQRALRRRLACQLPLARARATVVRSEFGV